MSENALKTKQKKEEEIRIFINRCFMPFIIIFQLKFYSFLG
jgi:hypothetical protein